MSGVVELLPIPDQYMTLGASGLVTLGRVRLNHVILTAGANDLNVDFYDGRDDTGKFVFSLDALANYSRPWSFGYTLEFRTGIYVVITGAGGKSYLSWQPVEVD